jgi:pyruvate kinase
VSLTYRELPGDVVPGDVLLLSDGALELAVESVSGADIACRVVVGGRLGAHKGINLPSRSLRVPFLTQKDEEDIRFGIEEEVDYVALSFVRTTEDIRRAREIIGESTPIIAKIEKHEALTNLDAILDIADGIMVARGDLGVEIPIERVPRVQKMLIEKANAAGKLVITATQMLRSMVDSPRPTRAEVTDVANAVLDGSDAVMLSEETAVGSYPAKTVAMMARIAADAELAAAYYGARPGAGPALRRQSAVARAACQLAADVDAAAVITCTQSGSTTRQVAKHRPNQLLLGLTPESRTYRELALVWGVVPIRMEGAASQEEMEEQAVRLGLGSGLLKPGDTVVITAGVPLHVSGMTNAIRLVRL